MAIIAKDIPRNIQQMLLSGLLIITVGLSSAKAQNYQKVQPKTPPVVAPPAEVPEATLPDNNGGKEIFLKKLVAIVFVDSIDKIQQEAKPASGIVTNGLPFLESPEFHALVTPYLDQPLSMFRLQTLVREIVLYFRRQDRPVVDVSLPQQDITGGVLQIVVTESKVGEIRVEGNKWFSSKSLINLIRLRTGDEISGRRLEADVDTINQNPFCFTTIVFSASKEIGATDIILQTRDRFPARFYTGYENTGNTITGVDRYFAGFNWGDAFGLGHQLNYQFETSGDGQASVANSGSYISPLPWGHTLTIFGAISQSQADIAGVNLNGSGSQIGVRYKIPIEGVEGIYSHDFTLGYDWKQSSNSLDFGTIPVNASETDVGEIVFSYHGTVTDTWGATTINPQIFWSPAQTWSHELASDYTSSRLGSTPEYAYLRLEVSRITQLPAKFSLSNDFQYQISNAPLLSSEQLEFGGSQSIRGYNENDISGADEGWTLRNELRLPTISFGKLINLPIYQDQLQFLGFVDMGDAWAHTGQLTDNDGNARNDIPMVGVGPGLRYTIGQYVSIRADYGFQLLDTGDRTGSCWSISAILSY